MNREQIQHINTKQVPRWTKHLIVGPVSQVNIQASPASAESYEFITEICNECQSLADEFGKPIVLTDKHGGRYAFNPTSETETRLSISPDWLLLVGWHRETNL